MNDMNVVCGSEAILFGQPHTLTARRIDPPLFLSKDADASCKYFFNERVAGGKIRGTERMDFNASVNLKNERE